MEESAQSAQQEEVSQSPFGSTPFSKKIVLIILAAIVGGFILAMLLVTIRTSGVPKTVPIPTSTFVSPTESFASPTGIQVGMPTSSIVQCKTGADCIGMSYCTDSEPPKCHTFICLKGYCREAIDEVRNEDIIRPMPRERE